MNISVLRDEINIDPLGIGYSGMTDIEVMNSLNNVTVSEDKDEITGYEISLAILDSEYNSLQSSQKDQCLALCAKESVFDWGFVRNSIEEIFGTSTTLTALDTGRAVTVSRADQLGLGEVRLGHVEAARAV